MKHLLILPLLILTLAGFGQLSKNFIDQNYIEVSGKADMEITPDEIYLKILIDEQDNKGKETLEQLEDKMVKQLEKLGIDIDSQLVIKDFSSNFKFYLLKKTDIYTSKEFQLLVHDGKTVGNVFLELEKLGISNIQIDHVDHSKIEEYRRKVKIEAIKAGREKAEDLASAIGQSIGKAIYIREVENFNVRPYNSNIMIRGLATKQSIVAEPLDLEFEKIPLEYTVQVYFELK